MERIATAASFIAHYASPKRKPQVAFCLLPAFRFVVRLQREHDPGQFTHAQATPLTSIRPNIHSSSVRCLLQGKRFCRI